MWACPCIPQFLAGPLCGLLQLCREPVILELHRADVAQREVTRKQNAARAARCAPESGPTPALYPRFSLPSEIRREVPAQYASLAEPDPSRPDRLLLCQRSLPGLELVHLPQRTLCEPTSEAFYAETTV